MYSCQYLCKISWLVGTGIIDKSLMQCVLYPFLPATCWCGSFTSIKRGFLLGESRITLKKEKMLERERDGDQREEKREESEGEDKNLPRFRHQIRVSCSVQCLCAEVTPISPDTVHWCG